MILNKYFLKNSSSAKHQQISSTKHCKQTIHNQCGKLSTPWLSPLEYSQFGGGKIGNENERHKISTLRFIRWISIALSLSLQRNGSDIASISNHRFSKSLHCTAWWWLGVDHETYISSTWLVACCTCVVARGHATCLQTLSENVGKLLVIFRHIFKLQGPLRIHSLSGHSTCSLLWGTE